MTYMTRQQQAVLEGIRRQSRGCATASESSSRRFCIHSNFSAYFSSMQTFQPAASFRGGNPYYIIDRRRLQRWFSMQPACRLK